MQGNLANISEASEHLPESLSPTGAVLTGVPHLAAHDASTHAAEQRSHAATQQGAEPAVHSPRQDAASGSVAAGEAALAERMSGGSGVSLPCGAPAEEADPPPPGSYLGSLPSPGLLQYGPGPGLQGAAVTGVGAVRAAPLPSLLPPPPPPPAQPHLGQQGEPQPSQQLWDELRQRDAQILVLQKKLGHFRSWLAGVHAKVQAANPTAINNYKRLYVGNLPPHTTEEDLKAFLHGLMVRSGANAAPGNAILSCKLKSAPGAGGGMPPPGLPPGPPDKHYAFIELRSVEEASNAMAFDGVAFRNAYLKVRRPSNYDVATAMMLGPTSPDPTIDLSQLEICRTVVENSPHKLFVGGLPCEWSEDMVKELLAPYGTLKSFNLVMDKSTGKSKGYAFCEYCEESSADLLIKNLHMRRVGSKALTVKRAMEGNRSAAGSMGGSAGAGGGGGGSGGSSGGGAPPLTLGPSGHSGSLHTPLGGPHLGPHHGHPAGSVGSPPPLPLTPVGVAAMAKLAAASPAAPSTASPAQQQQHQQQQQQQQQQAGTAGAAAAAAAAAMAAALGGVAPDTSSPTALQVADAITALLQQHSGHLASRNLLAAAAAAAAAAGGGHPPGTPPPQPGAASTAAGIAAALQQFQRSAELSAGGGGGGGMAGAAGASSGELQSVGPRGQGHPHPHHQYTPHPHAHARSHHHHHQQQQQQQQQDAAAAAAAAQEVAQQQFAAAAAAAQQQGVGPFDLSGLTGQGMSFW